jgi:hypothetical protein
MRKPFGIFSVGRRARYLPTSKLSRGAHILNGGGLMKIALLLVPFVLIAGSVSADPITYEILTFHGTGNEGYHGNGSPPMNTPIQGDVAGTITTDGALGDITSSDIVAWSWNTGYSAGSSTSFGASIGAIGLVATPTTLTLLPGVSGVTSPGQLTLDNKVTSTTFTLSDENLVFQDIGGGITWGGSFFSVMQGGTYSDLSGAYSSPSLEIAAVGGGIPPGIPEPATVTLAAVGLVVGMAYRLSRRVR